MQGSAGRADIDTLIQMVNIVEALYRLGFGKEFAGVVTAGLEALRAVGRRGAESGKFILRAQEIKALNDVMELHDAQMEVIVLNDMERAIEIVHKEYARGAMTPIVTTS